MIAVADSVAIQETIASDSEGGEKLTERSDDASDGQTEKVEVQKTETTQTTVSSSSDELSDLTQSSEETAPEEVDEFIEESSDPQEQTISHEEETKEAVDSSTSDFERTRSSESFGEHISPSIDKPNEKIDEPVSSNEGVVVSRRSRRDLSAVSSNQSEEESVVAFDEKAFDAAIDQYIDHATEEELGLVIESSNEKEMTDALEYLLLNQLDESFGVEELDELKKFLTADEIERLENETSLETFEQLLTQYYNEREKKLEEGTAFSAFFLASTDEETDRMLETKDEQALEQVISEISASRNRQASGSRKKRALPLAIPLLVKGAMLVIGAGVAAYSSHQFYKTMEAQRAEKNEWSNAGVTMNNKHKNDIKPHNKPAPKPLPVPNYKQQPAPKRKPHNELVPKPQQKRENKHKIGPNNNPPLELGHRRPQVHEESQMRPMFLR
ncbi:hypothetical protein [Enterococcus faecalis]|uniref:hypothetical protein n=1 Tax=Enterococcus faecalis TaxID=1351 RepID=UPI0025B1BA3D|nr:hypothetical protein [Enterococcus faecalis]MDN3168371.1 hypothetical protein [Enterococcus faecalis]